MELMRDLRKGTIDVIVGINLLREGLDLPGGIPLSPSWTRTKKAFCAVK